VAPADKLMGLALLRKWTQSMFSHRIWDKPFLAVFSGLLMLYNAPGRTEPRDETLATSSPTAQTDARTAPAILAFVRVFSSADDVKPLHPVLNRTLDIIAGPADAATRVDTLNTPSAVATDSNHRVFVADPDAKAVHVFDFIHSKYARLGGSSGGQYAPISLSVDSQDNLYVVDQSSRTVLVYDSAGKFLRHLGGLKGGESYFGGPAGIAVDSSTRRIYVCDLQAHIIFVMDERGKVIHRIGKRGSGDGPGEFRLPSQVIVANGELFVLDSGNARVQVLDLEGHFLRAINLGYADRRTGLAVDNQDNIYVSDPLLNQIQLFRQEGQRVWTFDLGTIKGPNLGHPSALWADAGRRLYVVDSQSNRIGVFQITTQRAVR
jgi:DNA-binding beta-propeller fold protein YncE